MGARILLSAVLVLASACVAVGPKTVQRDRIDYGTALATGAKEQAVLNIVKSRYADWPSFLDVSQIVAGYSLESSASLEWDWFPSASTSSELDTGVSGTFTESPTITFTPLVGSDFAETLLEPLDTEAVLALAYAGWKIDRLFEVALNSINGKRNAQFVGDTLQPAEAAFTTALERLRDLQRSDALLLRRSVTKTEPSTDKQSSTESSKDRLELAFREPAGDDTTRARIEELRSLLGLDPNRDRFEVVYSDSAGLAGQISVETRTLWEMIWELQHYVSVPPEDEAAARVAVLPPSGHGQPILDIRSGTKPPQDSFVAVPYRDRWFWIADDDIESKHTLSVILMMSTLARSGSAEPPRLVIPTR